MIVVIDNYDSFTWNMVDLLRRNQRLVKVYRNDEVSAEKVVDFRPRGILISPGPGRPADSGVSPEVLRLAAGKIPVLGICLGHQLIGEHFGMALSHGATPVHGKTSSVMHNGEGIFKGVPQGFQAMRYHSLVLSGDGVPETMEVTARTESGEVMAIRHRILPITGVQFHPESILTECGGMIVSNWIRGLMV